MRPPAFAEDPEPPLLYLLAEAAAWCLPRARLMDAAHCLRTPLLRPPAFPDAGPSAVDALVRARRQRVPHPLPLRPLPAGRILAYLSQAAPPDVALVDHSRGYFDSAGSPPWDTWLAVLEQQPPHTSPATYEVLSFVPVAFLGLVTRTLARVPVPCLALWEGDPTTWPDLYPGDLPGDAR